MVATSAVSPRSRNFFKGFGVAGKRFVIFMFLDTSPLMYNINEIGIIARHQRQHKVMS